MKRLGFGVAALVFLSAACSSDDGQSGDGGPFSTSIPGDKPLGGLSDSEATALCVDQANFLSRPDFRADSCRFSAVLFASLDAAFMPGTTDAELRKACSDFYAECMVLPADVSACNDAKAPLNCTATVSELAACLEDTSALLGELASMVPDCASLTVAGVTASNGGQLTTIDASPASCMTYQAKCSGISDAAKSFTDQYCELVAPCCTAAGLGSACNLNVERAARDGSFNEDTGAACLAALRERQKSDNYCDGLGYGSWEWDVIPECAVVFRARVGPDPESGRPTTGTLGLPCSGTIMRSYDGRPGNYAVSSSGGNPNDALCDHDQGLFCDPETFVCAAGHALGDYCESYEMCGSQSGYCDVFNHVCEARIPAGGACSGSLLGECAEGSYCAEGSLKCVALGGTGAACSEEVGPSSLPECASRICENGICKGALDPVCGG